MSIDTLFNPNARRKADIIEEVISSASDTHPIALISQYTQDEFENAAANIKRRIEQNRSALEVDVFFAENQIEQIIGPTNQLLKALRSMEERSCSTVLFTCRSTDVSAANECHLGTVLVCTNENEENEALKAGSDFTCSSVEEVHQILNGKLIGYLGELTAMPCLPNYVTRIGKYSAAYYQYQYDPAYPKVVITGRYFKTSDPRFNKHALSGSLLDAKNNHDRHSRKFGKIIGKAASLVTNDLYDLITRVPPQISSSSDRLGDYITAGAGEGELKAEKIDLDVIRCVREYQPQHFAGSYEARRDNVEGVFGIHGNIAGKRIVLIDDIITSGSTIRSATDSLMNAGCAKVIPVVIAMHPGNNPIDEPMSVGCDQCGGKLKQRFNNENGQIFLGCENFPNCRNTMRFIDGLAILNDFTGEIVTGRGYIEDIPF